MRVRGVCVVIARMTGFLLLRVGAGKEGDDGLVSVQHSMGTGKAGWGRGEGGCVVRVV